jgi:hypothetical protein
MNFPCKFLTMAAVAFLVVETQAVTIFSDNFNSENGGAGTLNYNSFANWKVTSGTVDLIGNGFFDFLPGNGLYIDMDGSSSSAGTMDTKSGLINLSPGQYVLSYQLAGNHRNNSTELVNVAVKIGLATANHSLLQNAPFTTFTLPFTVSSSMAVQIEFQGTGGDNIGMILDNVQLDQVQVPDGGSTVVLLGIALCGAGFVRRKLTYI